MAHLRRTSDGAGDSGSRSEAISWNDDRTVREIVGRRPVIGCSMLVGGVTARSYSRQDYWLTTTVTEILEEISTEDCDYVKFSTGNSIYEWWEGTYPKEDFK
jgi:hypothetical protein